MTPPCTGAPNSKRNQLQSPCDSQVCTPTTTICTTTTTVPPSCYPFLTPPSPYIPTCPYPPPPCSPFAPLYPPPPPPFCPPYPPAACQPVSVCQTTYQCVRKTSQCTESPTCCQPKKCCRPCSSRNSCCQSRCCTPCQKQEDTCQCCPKTCCPCSDQGCCPSKCSRKQGGCSGGGRRPIVNIPRTITQPVCTIQIESLQTKPNRPPPPKPRTIPPCEKECDPCSPFPFNIPKEIQDGLKRMCGMEVSDDDDDCTTDENDACCEEPPKRKVCCVPQHCQTEECTEFAYNHAQNHYRKDSHSPRQFPPNKRRHDGQAANYHGVTFPTGQGSGGRYGHTNEHNYKTSGGGHCAPTPTNAYNYNANSGGHCAPTPTNAYNYNANSGGHCAPTPTNAYNYNANSGGHCAPTPTNAYNYNANSGGHCAPAPTNAYNYNANSGGQCAPTPTNAYNYNINSGGQYGIPYTYEGCGKTTGNSDGYRGNPRKDNFERGGGTDTHGGATGSSSNGSGGHARRKRSLGENERRSYGSNNSGNNRYYAHKDFNNDKVGNDYDQTDGEGRNWDRERRSLNEGNRGRDSTEERKIPKGYRRYSYNETELATKSEPYLEQSYPVPPPHTNNKKIHPLRAPIVDYRKNPEYANFGSPSPAPRPQPPPRSKPTPPPAYVEMGTQKRTRKVQSEPNFRKNKGKFPKYDDMMLQEEDAYNLIPIYRTTTQTRLEVIERPNEPSEIRVIQRPVQELVGYTRRDPNANVQGSQINVDIITPGYNDDNGYAGPWAEGAADEAFQDACCPEPCAPKKCLKYNTRRLHRLCSFSKRRRRRLSQTMPMLHMCKFKEPDCPIRETIASILRKKPPQCCKWHEKDMPVFHEFCMTDHNRDINRHLITRPASNYSSSVQRRGTKRRNHHR